MCAGGGGRHGVVWQGGVAWQVRWGKERGESKVERIHGTTIIAITPLPSQPRAHFSPCVNMASVAAGTTGTLDTT